jgi:hypothetical protein
MYVFFPAAAIEVFEVDLLFVSYWGVLETGRSI